MEMIQGVMEDCVLGQRSMAAEISDLSYSSSADGAWPSP